MSSSVRPRRRPQPKRRIQADSAAPLALAIDTSGAVEALTVVQGDLVLADQRVRRPRRRGTALGVAIAALLDSVGRSPSDLTAITVGLGPGAFTGLRVGIATAHGLARALDIPLFGFDSTLGLACAPLGHTGETVVVLDARRDEVYSAFYTPGESLPVVTVPTMLHSPAELGTLLSSRAPALLLGDGARLYSDVLLAEAPQHRVAGLHPSGPALAAVARDTIHRFEAGERPPIASIQPVYLRDHDAAKKMPKTAP